ncbi:MAG: hypothetical protein VB089_00580 [Anaerolineaceae bacterium]|nr:hypothetical protein [Anaerolineaceae bacterium]
MESDAPHPNPTGPQPPTPHEDGRVRVEIGIDLPVGATVHLLVETQAEEPYVRLTRLPEGENPPAPPSPRALLGQAAAAAGQTVAGRLRAWGAALRRLARTPLAYSEPLLVGAILLLYLGIHLVDLPGFPMYFSSDEVHTATNALALVREGGYGPDYQFLPTFFPNDNKYTLGTTVYLQLLPNLIFGRSIWVVRGTSALVGLLGLYWLGRILRDVLRLRYWWAGALVFTVLPIWFLFSRTAYETPQMTAFFTGFLYYYLLYRLRQPRYLYPALLLGALTFYSYFPGQTLIVLCGLCLLVVDRRYHWEHRDVALRGLGLLALLAFPLLRFLLAHPDEYGRLMSMYNSYWTRPLSLDAKLSEFLSNYVYALSPAYWFFPHEHDPILYQVPGYGYISWFWLPFAAAGLYWAVRNGRQVAPRTILIAALAVPAGSALIRVEVPRLLAMIVPFTLLIAVGLSDALSWLERRRLPRPALAYMVLIAISGFGIAMARDALVFGYTWYHDFYLGGVQYGADRIARLALEYRTAHPDTQVYISGGWTFYAGDVIYYLLPDNPEGINMGCADPFTASYRPDIEQTLFILDPPDYRKALNDDLFEPPQVEDIVPYPDGSPGFYLTRLHYREDAPQRIQQRNLPDMPAVGITTNVAHAPVMGQECTLRYSPLAEGRIEFLFDGDPATGVRTAGENPLQIEVECPNGLTLSGLTLYSNEQAVELRATLDPGQYQLQAFAGAAPADQPVRLDFEQPHNVWRLHLQLFFPQAGAPASLRLWELDLGP